MLFLLSDALPYMLYAPSPPLCSFYFNLLHALCSFSFVMLFLLFSTLCFLLLLLRYALSPSISIMLYASSPLLCSFSLVMLFLLQSPYMLYAPSPSLYYVRFFIFFVLLLLPFRSDYLTIQSILPV